MHGSIHDETSALLVPHNPVVQEELDRLRETVALEVLAHLYECRHRVSVIDSARTLINNWPGIELIRDEVRCRTNHFDAALIRLLIRPRALEGRKQSVMDVHDILTVAAQELW